MLLKVAMKYFVDNIVIQGVEDLLIGELWGILSPSRTMQMGPELVGSIASESQGNQTRRDQLSHIVAVLRKGLETCKRYASRNAQGK